jgi:hypothetical protein
VTVVVPELPDVTVVLAPLSVNPFSPTCTVSDPAEGAKVESPL